MPPGKLYYSSLPGFRGRRSTNGAYLASGYFSLLIETVSSHSATATDLAATPAVAGHRIAIDHSIYLCAAGHGTAQQTVEIHYRTHFLSAAYRMALQVAGRIRAALHHSSELAQQPNEVKASLKTAVSAGRILAEFLSPAHLLSRGFRICFVQY